jgi:uncharacterized phage protein (TIGR01671 family)
MNDRFVVKDKYFKTEVIKTSTNNNWKGGLYIAGGYAKVKVKEHPAKDKRGYVLLHRLVMEDHLGRYLNNDEFIHHKDGNKLNNELSNLELIYPEKHAKEHYSNRRVDDKTGRFICDEPKFNEIMFRLYGKDRNCMKEYSLSKLIYTKFKRNKFEYRGMSTGLKDKNGNFIYEGDIILSNLDYGGTYFVIVGDVRGYCYDAVAVCEYKQYLANGKETCGGLSSTAYHIITDHGPCVVVGNIHENPELLEDK